MTEITFTGDALALSAWRALARGAELTLSPTVLTRVDEGAAVVAAIVKKGEAVYGINTGFGKLANVRIADRDLETLQRNLVLSHAAGVGDLVPSRIARLMMALKLASLGRGASGVRRETMLLLQGMLAGNVIPAIPAQGSVGASGDLAPLAHLAAAMIGEGDAFYGGERMPAVYALGRA
jgi:histidine ammonia-lyase